MEDGRFWWLAGFVTDVSGLCAQMPTILADNGGYDSSDLVARLRAAHYEGQADAGLGE